MENVTTPFFKRVEYRKKFLIFGIVCFVNSRLVGNTLSTPSLKASRTVAAEEVLIRLKLLYTMYIALRRKADLVRSYSSAFKNKVKCSLSIHCCSLLERSKVQIPTRKPASLTKVFAVVLSSFSRYKANTSKYAHTDTFSIFPT
jgi:hypothetical protein